MAQGMQPSLSAAGVGATQAPLALHTNPSTQYQLLSQVVRQASCSVVQT